MSQEQEWSEALRRAKQNTNFMKTSLKKQDDDVLMNQMTEQLHYYKVKFMEAQDNNDSVKIQSLAERLINTHARMTTLLIKKEKARGAFENSPQIRNLLKKYFVDGRKLLRYLSKS